MTGINCNVLLENDMSTAGPTLKDFDVS